MSTVNRAKHIGVRNMTSYDTRKRKYIPMGQFKGDFEEMDWLFDADHNFEGQVIRVTAKAILLNHQSDSSSMRKDSQFPKSVINILDSWEETRDDRKGVFSREINVQIPFWAYE